MASSMEGIDNYKEYKPILQQQILDKELAFMEEVKNNHESFKELDSNISQLIQFVDDLRERVNGLSNELNEFVHAHTAPFRTHA